MQGWEKVLSLTCEQCRVWLSCMGGCGTGAVPTCCDCGTSGEMQTKGFPWEKVAQR